jgi:hypothetical protein
MAANNTNVIHALQSKYFTLCRPRDFTYGHQAINWERFKQLPSERPEGSYMEVQCKRCSMKLAKIDNRKTSFKEEK